MLQKPDIWVVAGLPGSGKSVITDRLIAEGLFDGFEVSANHARLVKELGPERIDVVMDRSRYASQDEHIDAMRDYAEAVSAKLTHIKQHYSSVLRPAALSFFSYFSSFPPHELLRQILANPIDFLMPFFAFMNSIDVLERASERAEQKEKSVLLTGADFMHLRTRKQAHAFFKLRRIAPQLIIVRATRERLMQVAEEREKDPDVDPGRTMTEIHLMNPPYSPSERWDRVLVVNNTGTIESAVADMRRKLARPAAFHVGNPVNLLIESNRTK